jgi:hypothetical protein
LPEEGQSVVEFDVQVNAPLVAAVPKYQTDGALMMALRGRTLNKLEYFKDWVRYADWACVVFIVASVAFAFSVLLLG